MLIKIGNKEQVQKPLEAMSQLERDTYFGEFSDLGDERKEFAKNFAEVELIEGIYDHVCGIMKLHNKNGTLSLAQCLVVNTVKGPAARFVAGYCDLHLVTDNRMPENEVWVCEAKNCERLIVSRQLQHQQQEAAKPKRLHLPRGWNRK